MRRFFTILLCLFASLPALSFSDKFVRVNNLTSLDNATVYSAVQDSTKAIWISCSAGLMRYNGSSIREVYEVLPMQKLSYDDGDKIWALSYNGLICVDIFSFKTTVINKGATSVDFSRSKVFATTSGTMLFHGRDIWSVQADTLSLLMTLPTSGDIEYADDDSRGRLYVASGKMLWRIAEGRSYPVMTLPSGISSFYFDSSGYFWVGFMHGGISKYDSHFNLLATYQLQATNVRTFCEDKDGSLWAGSAASLHCLSPQGVWQSAEAPSEMAQPVTSLLKDAAGNMWVGTFYSGVYMASGYNVPFENLQVPASLRKVRCASPLRDGEVVVLTDGNGAWIYDKDGAFRKVRGSGDYKFISSLHMDGEDAVYAGLYRGGIVKVSRDAVTPVVLTSAEEPLSYLSANDMLLHSGKLYVATDEGLYAFEPSGKAWVGSLVEGIDSQMLSLGADEQNRLWVCGRGLYVLEAGEAPHKVSDGFYPAISCSQQGVWASEFGKGVCRIHASGISRFDDRNAGILNNSISFIQPLPGQRFLLGTRSGLTILDYERMLSLNYNNKNGISISSARSGCAISLDGGNYLVFGTDGAAVFRVQDIPQMSSLPPLKLDIIEEVGEQAVFRPMSLKKPLRLHYNQNNLVLEFSNFDYSDVYARNYDYTLSGLNGEWRPFNHSVSLSMIDLKPGNYKIMTRPNMSDANVSSFSFRVLRPWYSSVLALILYSITATTLVLYFIYNLYGRLLLRQQLRDKETENEERTKLFIKLSHELRTPLTSVIGQLSLFFKRYGTELPGNALLRQSYRGALEMNQIVSNFLEVENALEDEVDDLPAFDRSLMYPAGQGEYTMLVADDNSEMRILLQDIFSEEYKLLIAKNGREAYEIARKNQPDIIVSDVMMPEMDGLTLCATLRKDYETRHIPIVLITAHASERHNLEGLSLGADDYIAKPFSVELLRARCRSLILNRKAIAEHMYMNGGAVIPTNEGKENKFINAAIGAVERNITSSQLNVALLCQEMNMSKTTLTLRLNESTGMSPRDFIEDVRLRHAARMIRDGEVRPADIAAQLNFSSPKYFSIRFRKKFGVSPRDYAKGEATTTPSQE